MITNLNIQNFKSLKNAALSLGKITVMTGANNSGKSSFIYSLLALKNTMTNPNQSIDACLTLPFINFGGFQQTVFRKDESQNIVLEMIANDRDIEVGYTLSIGKVTSFLEITAYKPYKFSAKLEIALPYPATKNQGYSFDHKNFQVKWNWNGIMATAGTVSLTGSVETPDPNQLEKINKITDQLNRIFQLPFNEFAGIDFVPLRRGFTTPYFIPVPFGALIATEAEIASLLAHDRDLVGKVAFYLEKIVERTFSVYTTPGTANFYLQAMDRENGFTADLVNEGLGTNQLVTILAKIMQKSNKFICIDEPEIHLHPTIIDKLVSVLIEMAEHEEKQFLISTHSEHFISALLKHVVEGKIKNEAIRIYYLDKTRNETKTEYQEINAAGQIKGGLKNFYQTELNNLQTFFKITD